MKEWMKQQYERFVFKTIGTPLFMRRIEYDTILEWLDPNEDERILDIGCTRGALILRISLKSHHTYGIDLAPKDIEWAQRFAQSIGLDCAFTIGNAEALPYPNDFFDKIVCSSALEHFEKDSTALNEMNRVLRPGGVLILTVDSFTYPIGKEWKARHKLMFDIKQYYDRHELQTLLTASGFEMVRGKYILHSKVATFFLKKHIKHRNSLVLTIINSFIAYPPVLLFEKLSDDAHQGYTLLAEGRKLQRNGFHSLRNSFQNSSQQIRDEEQETSERDEQF
jgi:SAM-dependent methyltransferase